MLRACIRRTPRVPEFAVSALQLAHAAALRHTSSLLFSHARSSFSTPSPPLQAREALRTRSFSSTAQRRADEAPNVQLMFEQQKKLLKLLQEKPEVLDNIKEFVGLLKDNGVDVQSGRLPSKMEMFRLLMKTEVRDSAMKMAAAFQEAGIDLQSQDMMQSLMTMQKQLPDK